MSNFESDERQAIMFCRCGCAGNRKVTTVCPIPHYNALEGLAELLTDELKKEIFWKIFKELGSCKGFCDCAGGSENNNYLLDS